MRMFAGIIIGIKQNSGDSETPLPAARRHWTPP
jgi:hypothetical protein